MTSTTAASLSADPAIGRAADSAIDAAARRAARIRIFKLVRIAQADAGLTVEMVQDIVDEADANGWPDVAKLGIYLGIIRSRWVERTPDRRWIKQLLARAERDEDATVTALALAARSQTLDAAGGRGSVEADRDLARAIVLLEGQSGISIEAASAHMEVALSCEKRDIWELQLQHYDLAEACLDIEEGAERRPALLYNRAEVQVNWVAALRERGDVPELAECAALARAALALADHPLMPEDWLPDLAILHELIDAIDPPGGVFRRQTAAAVGDFAGYVHLSRALAADSIAEARTHADLAVETIDRQANTRMYLLALSLAVELEAAEAGRETAGLRWGRELVDRRWERRMATLASMQSLIEVERLASEHAMLQQHAFLDDLTGLANRRGLARFADGLRGRGAGTVAVVLVDLDRFKSVNDGHGHAVGDAALVRMAAILRGGVREQDLVVRIGGDEFLLLLTMAERDAARRRCASIVEAIADARWGEVAADLRVSASLGLGVGSLEDFEDLYATADAALYRAKQAGGARVLD